MQRIRIDLCNLVEVDGFKLVFVCIYHFSKWSETKTAINKSGPTDCMFISCHVRILECIYTV